jgi:two-component system chemotaxis sensor kinase CheA
MDDLLLEFLTETNESLDVVDVELVKFEQDPQNAQILDNIFRLVHTIKGTCGFLGLPRLESLAHAAETLMGKYRDGAPVTQDGVSVILASIDRLKAILGELEATGTEPGGDDQDLITELDAMSEAGEAALKGEPVPEKTRNAAPEDENAADAAMMAEEKPEKNDFELPDLEIVERELKPGEVPLDELERIFQETETEFDAQAAAKEAAMEALAGIHKNQDKASKEAQDKQEKEASDKPGDAGKPNLSAQSIRVSVETLENLMTMVSELVLTRNQLLEIVRRHEDSEFKVPLQRLSNVTAELQEGVMKTRMQPIGNAWQKLPRIVRDLAQELDKDIDLVMHGADTELDRQVLDLIKDPLTHMVRNSADHGLETPAERKAAGKSAKGTIKLSAFHEGGHIIIEIADDGKGLNAARLKEKIIQNKLASESEVASMTEAQIHKFIFHAGFSTAAKVTNVSGRGVGMDVVRNNIEVIGGTIDLKSVEGQGTTFTIKIPLTLAIVSALIVESCGERFAIPQLAVVELVRVQSNSEHRIERIKDTPVLRLRNKLLPLSHMSYLLGLEDKRELDQEDEGFIIVMQVGSQTFGLVVDAVFHTEEIVVKPMSSLLRHLTMFSGNTILGDGSVIMIIDPNGMAQAIGSSLNEELAQETKEEKQIVSDRSKVTSMLLFRAGSPEPKAVPLSLVTRLEEIEVEQIELSNGRYLVQYRGNLMPLVMANDKVTIKDKGSQPMLVFADDNHTMGLVVDDIMDIVDDHLSIEVSSEKQGVLGSAVIRGNATEILDVGYYLPLAFEDWFLAKEGPTFKKGRSVLLIDDSAFFRNMLSPVLASAGYEVTSCPNAEEALKMLQQGKMFDVIVSDIEMPGLSGFDFTEVLRKNDAFKNIPIIAMSSHATGEAIERGRKAGFTDYVAKFDRSGLISVLKEQTYNNTGAAA